MSGLDQAMAGKKQRLSSPYSADSALNQSEEVQLGTSSTQRPAIENARPTDATSLQMLSRVDNLVYVNIDRISKAGTALYQHPATTSPGALVTLGHISELKAGMTVFIFEGDVWELEATYPDILGADGALIAIPKQAVLLTVY